MGTCFSCIDKTLVETIPQFTPTETGQRRQAIVSLQDQPHVLDLQLCEVSVMTSHNSYIRTLQQHLLGGSRCKCDH